MTALKDLGWLLLVVVMCPLAIVVVGVPIALVVRLLIELVERL